MSGNFADRCMELLDGDGLHFVFAYWLMVIFYFVYDIMFHSHPRNYVDKLCADGRVWRFYDAIP